MKRSLAVDNEPVAQRTLQRDQAYERFETRETLSETDILHQSSIRFLDLVFLDITLSDQDRFALCRAIREQGHIPLPIVLLTTRDTFSNLFAGLNGSAHEHISEPLDVEALLAQIHTALRHIEGLSRAPDKIRVGELLLDTQLRQVWHGTQSIELTGRECDLLEMFMLNAGQVLTKERIFDHVWGYDNDAGWEVIKVYINSLRSKLNEEGMANLIQTVRGIGYRFKAEAQTDHQA